jgi:hypothetical protein
VTVVVTHVVVNNNAVVNNLKTVQMMVSQFFITDNPQLTNKKPC